MELWNDTVLNVSALLRESVGSTRDFDFHLDSIELDRDLASKDVDGHLRLIKLTDAILAQVTATASVPLTCMRCLAEYDQEIGLDFQEEFRVAYDVRTGLELSGADDDERFAIDDAHQLDFGEPLRQEIIVGLPIRPVCGPECPGPTGLEEDETDDGDDRFAILQTLLDTSSLN